MGEIRVKVFYSWQSDLRADTNRNFIREALRNASSTLETEFGDQNLCIIVDDATRNCPGSPNIPSTILQKIEGADIFVCDISTINNDAAKGRRVPNPNVMLELGYSIAHLGWERIIILFNEVYGNFESIPFDISRNRCSKYKASGEKNERKQSIDNLTQTLIEAIKQIIEHEPIKPKEVNAFNAEQRKRNCDIKTVERVLKNLHVPTIDRLIEEAPYKIIKESMFFYEGFKAAVKSSLFFLYDQQLAEYIEEIYNSWDAILSNDSFYSPNRSGDYIFYNPLDLPFDEEQEKARNLIEKSRIILQQNIRGLILHIQKDYLEIDMNKLSKEAWKDYVDFHKDLLSEE